MEPLVDDVSLGGVDEEVLFRRNNRRSLVDVELEDPEESEEMECAVVEALAPDLWRLRIEVGFVLFISSLLDDGVEELREELREREPACVSFDREFVLEALEKVRLRAAL